MSLSTTAQVSPYPQQMLDDVQNTTHVHHFSYPISPTSTPSSAPVSSQDPTQSASVRTSSPQSYSNGTYSQSPPLVQPPQPTPPTQSDDLRYWNNMFRDLGFGEAVDQNYPAQAPSGTGTLAPSSHQHALPPHHQSYGNGRTAGIHAQPY